MKKALWAVMFLAPAGLAQEEDAPGKGVARLSLIAGDVSVKRGDTNEWVAAAINGPVLAGDTLLSGTGSRAEVQFDWANLVRLSTDTELRMGELDNNRYQIQLARGTIMFAVVRDSDADVDIATPSVSVRPLKKGMYRVTVRDDADGLVTEISVRSGEAEIFSPQGSQRLKAGRTMLVRGSTSDPEFRSVADIPDDEWDQWNDRRNNELLRSTSYNYVDRNIYGAEALDGYGQWANVAPYGMVWQPTVAVGWAPYRYGRWTWANYYGWTWLSYDPWGWAPYHYGRWFWASNRWCWWPGGGGGIRPYWRPALVAWVGWGAGGWSGGIGVGRGGYGWGHVGWVPLAPHEPFYPWYGRRGGTRIVNNTTIVNNINVTNIYRNARINNGVTVVERERFGRGSVHNVGVAPDRLNQAQVARGMLPVVPDRDATRWSDRNISQDSMRSQPANQQFYSRHRGAPAQQVSFADQRRNVEQVARNAFGESPGGGSGSGTEAPRQAGAPSEGRRVGQGGEGWRRVGDNQPSLGSGGGSSYQSSGPRQPAVSSPDAQTMRGRSGNGWQRFGEPRQADNGQTAPQRSASEGWRRVGGSAGVPSASGESLAPARSRESGGTGSTYGRESRGWERFGAVPDAGSARSNRGIDSDSGSSVNINPPMVRDRSGSFGGSYGRSQSIPRSESPRSYGGPRMESPSMSAPARGSSIGGFGVGGGSRGPSGGGPSMSGPRMQSAPSAGGGTPSRGSDGGGGSVSRGSSGRGGGRGR